MMNLKQTLATSGLALLGLAISATSFADSRAEIDAGVNASVKAFYADSAKHKELAADAAGVLVFPHITKGGVGVAGEYGEGVLLIKGKTVGYYSISGASLGLTLGAGQRSEVRCL